MTRHLLYFKEGDRTERLLLLIHYFLVVLAGLILSPIA